MQIRTRIAAVARSRGLTAAEIARRLGGYRSNLSAMDAGRRAVSFRMLARLSRLLDCSPADLLEVSWGPKTPVFRQSRLNRRLKQQDLGTPDGLEKGWVHAVLLGWQRHYRTHPRTR